MLPQAVVQLPDPSDRDILPVRNLLHLKRNRDLKQPWLYQFIHRADQLPRIALHSGHSVQKESTVDYDLHLNDTLPV